MAYLKEANMKKNLKILLHFLIIGAIIFVGLKVGGYFFKIEKENKRLHTELIGQKEKYIQLTEHTAQLETQYEQQRDLYEKAKKEFKEVSKEKDERIKLLSDATYLIGRHVEKQNGPDYYFETKGRTRNYVLNELRIAGAGSPPIGYILIKHDGRTYKRNYRFEVEVKTLQTVDENTGRIKVYSKAYLTQKEASPLKKRIEGYKDWENVKYPLNIVGGTAIVDPTVANQLAPRFHWWAPHINANVNFVGEEPAAGLGISVAGYGKHKNDLSFRFLQLGAHYNQEFGVQGTLTPILWRPLPSIFSNTYLGPGISLKDDGVGYFMGVQVGL